MLITDEHLTLRKNSHDADHSCPYVSRTTDSDGDDESRRNASNVDIVQHRETDYDSAVRPLISTPQYHLMPTDEEETERRQSAKGQQLERMQRRRNARLNRQSVGISTADTVPGFRGEASLEELINYIDAPASTETDYKTAKKSKKKKKKLSSVADGLESSRPKLANSCEVFVGSFAVSFDEPSVRVGDSCCIELRKKSDTSVDHSVYSPDCVDVSDNACARTDTSHFNVKLTEDLSQVVYAEVKTTPLEDENESVTTTAPGEETLAVGFERLEGNIGGNEETLAVGFERLEGNIGGNEETLAVGFERLEDNVIGNADVSLMSVNITHTVSTENTENNSGNTNKHHQLDNILPVLTGSDTVTSDTGSVEDMFVTVQKKKRSKNAGVIGEDQWQRFAHRSSTKRMEDRDGGYCIKRTWVKSADAAASVVPCVSVSRSSVVDCRPSCPVTQRSAAWHSQPSNPDTVLSSSKYTDKSAQSSKTWPEGNAQQNSVREPTSKEPAACILSQKDTVCRSDENKTEELQTDLNTPVSTRAPAVSKQWQASAVCECDMYVSSDISMRTGDASCCGSDVKQEPFIGDPGNVPVDESPQLSVHNSSASDVFLDTRNIEGTTPPRSDISFGFDPTGSPEPLDVSANQHSNPPGGRFSAMPASCHGPVVAPMPAPVAGCPPILYFYPAMPMTFLPPVATFGTGRCTPIGVVPPMPAVADVPSISVTATTWQSTDDKVISDAVLDDGQNMADNEGSVASDAPAMSTSNKATNAFVLSAAQRYLYSGMLPSCTVVLLYLRMSDCHVAFIIV